MKNKPELSKKIDEKEIKKEFTEQQIRDQIKEYGQGFIPVREKIRVLYLDDEIDELESFQSLYRRIFKVFIASDPQVARDIVAKEDLHVILTDQRMDAMSGVQFLDSIIEDFPEPVRILVTGYSDISAVISSINVGQVYKYISKPYPREAMQKSIENAAEVFNLRRDREQLVQKLVRACSQLEFLLRQNSLDV